MKRFCFVAQMRGVYTSLIDINNPCETSGISLYLGISRGETVQEACDSLMSKHSLKVSLPDIMKAKVWAFEIVGEGLDVKIKDVDDNNNLIEVAPPKYPSIKCAWCGEPVSSNGAAQFAHLKKHLNQLVGAKLLTSEQMASVRSIQLEPTISSIMTSNRKLFKSKIE